MVLRVNPSPTRSKVGQFVSLVLVFFLLDISGLLQAPTLNIGQR